MESMFVKLKTRRYSNLTLFFLISWLLSNPTYAQEDYEIERQIRIKNKVTEIRQYYHDLTRGDSTLESIDHYNKDGEITHTTSYLGSRKIISKQTYEYDDRGNIIRQKSFDHKGKLTGTFEFEYDEEGNRTDYRQIRDGVVLVHQIRKYENSLNTELINKKFGSDQYYTATRYYYNEDGLYSKIENYHETGELTTVYVYKYYPEERKKEAFRTNGSETGISSITFLNADGLATNIYYPRRSDIKRYRSLKKLDIREEKRYEYDSEGNLISKSLWFGGELFEKTSYVVISEE